MKMRVKTLVAAGALAATAGMASATQQIVSVSGTGGAIPDSGQGVLTRTVVVNGALPIIQDMTVTLNNLVHTWVGDLWIRIQGPNGMTGTMVHRIGQTSATSAGDSSDYNGTYTFADTGANIWQAAAAIGGTAAIPSGTYFNSGGDGVWAGFGPPNGPGPNNAFATKFGGSNPNGTWTLTISDHAGADVGSLGSWRLDLKLIPAPVSAAMLGLAGLVGLRRRR